MAEQAHQRIPIGHPAPMRDRVSGVALWFAIAAAPLVWLAQLLVGFSFPSILCFPDFPRAPAAAPPGWIGPVIASTNLLALAVSLIALAVGLFLLRRTRDEHEDQPGGAVDAGEGRTRFLAIWGSVTAVLFALAIAFNTIDLWLVPQCPA